MKMSSLFRRCHQDRQPTSQYSVFSRNNCVDLALILLCMIAGSVVRTGYRAYFFNPDEASLVLTSSSSLRGMFLDMSWEKHPFGSYVIRHVMLFFGGEVDYLRLFSLIPSLLTIPIIYLIGRMKDRIDAMIYALLAVFAPGLAIQGQLFRHYALLVFSVTLATFGLLLFVQRKRRSWLCLTLGLCLAVLTHYSGWLVAACLIPVVALNMIHARRQEVISPILSVLCIGASMALCIPRLLLPTPTQDLEQHYSQLFAIGSDSIIDRWCEVVAYLFGEWTVYPVSIALIIGGILQVRKNPYVAAFGGVLIGMAFVLEHGRIYPLYGRYAIYLFCPVVILMVETIQPLKRLLHRLKPLSSTSIKWGLCIVLAASVIVISLRYSSQLNMRNEFPIKRAEFQLIWRAVDEQLEDGSIVISDLQAIFYAAMLNGTWRDLPDNWISVERNGVRFISRSDGFWILNRENILSGMHQISQRDLENKNVWLLHIGWQPLPDDVETIVSHAKQQGYRFWQTPSGKAALFEVPWRELVAVETALR